MPEIFYNNKDGLIFVAIISVIFLISKFFSTSEPTIERKNVTIRKEKTNNLQNKDMTYDEKGEKLKTNSIVFFIIAFIPILIFLVIDGSTKTGGYGAMIFLAVLLIAAIILFCVFALTSAVFHFKFKKHQKSYKSHKK